MPLSSYKLRFYSYSTHCLHYGDQVLLGRSFPYIDTNFAQDASTQCGQNAADVLDVKRVVRRKHCSSERCTFCDMISWSCLKITSLYNRIKLVLSYLKNGPSLSVGSHFNHFREHRNRIQDLPEKEQRGRQTSLRPIEDIFSPASFYSVHSHSLTNPQREVTTY